MAMPNKAKKKKLDTAGGGNALRAAVLGANDGLVSNLSLVAGVFGAGISAHALLVSGLAGLIAGACSMAMGEWLSVNTSREFNEAQVAAESRAIQRAPQKEKRELAGSFEEKGLSERQAGRVVDGLFSRRRVALDVVAREKLGIDPEGLGGSAWIAGGTSFLLFAAGAAVPLLPFLFMSDATAVWVGAGLSGVVMFIIGAATSLVTRRGLFFSGCRQFAIGLGAAAITYGVGRLIGVMLAG